MSIFKTTFETGDIIVLTGIIEGLIAAFVFAKINKETDQFNRMLKKAIEKAELSFHEKEDLSFDTCRLEEILIQGFEKTGKTPLITEEEFIKELALQASSYEVLYLKDENKIYDKVLNIIEYIITAFEKLLLSSPETSGGILAELIKKSDKKGEVERRKIIQLLQQSQNQKSQNQNSQYQKSQNQKSQNQKSQDQNPQNQKIRPIINTTIPYHSLGENFIGRDQSLQKIHSIIIDQQTTIITGVGIITGTGGLGKTQLAIEYAHRFKTFFPGGIFWVHAESGIQKMIEEISDSIGLPIDGTDTEEKQVNSLWKNLNNEQKILIILDNFSETDILKPWLPPSSGNIHTLITTRRKDITNYFSVELDFLKKEDGIKLLNSGKRKIGEAAGELVELLGRLPLALELARHYLNVRNDILIPQLIEDIKSTDEIDALDTFAKTYNQELPSGHSKYIVKTFQLSWELASKKGKQILKILSLLAPVPVPLSIIRQILNQEETISFKDPLLETIHEELFKRLSLVELGDQNCPYLHRLISGFVKTKKVETKTQLSVINAVETEMSRIRDDLDTDAYYELNKVVPHAEHLSLTLDNTDQKISILTDIADFYRQKGFYQKSKTYCASALASAQKIYEPGHPSIARNQSNLAAVLKDLGELKEACLLWRESYNSFKNLLGNDHHHTKNVKSFLDAYCQK